MNKNESNERFDEVKAKMDECGKAIGKGFETAQAVGAEAGERISKIIGEAKEKYGPKFEEMKKKAGQKFNDVKGDLKDYYEKFVEDVDKRKETMQEEKAAKAVSDKLDEADAFFEIAKAAQQRGQEAYQEAIEAQKEYDEKYSKKGTKKKRETKKDSE